MFTHEYPCIPMGNIIILIIKNYKGWKQTLA